MINIIGTYTDNLYVSTDVEYGDEQLIIRNGYKGNLKERYEGRKHFDEMQIPISDVFFTFQCYDKEFECTTGNLDFNEQKVRRLMTLPKKLAAAHLMAVALKQTTKGLFIRQILPRHKGMRILHQKTLYHGVDEFGFLFGLDTVSISNRGRRYKYVAGD